jgi:hypothetical protein
MRLSFHRPALATKPNVFNLGNLQTRSQQSTPSAKNYGDPAVELDGAANRISAEVADTAEERPRHAPLLPSEPKIPTQAGVPTWCLGHGAVLAARIDRTRVHRRPTLMRSSINCLGVPGSGAQGSCASRNNHPVRSVDFGRSGSAPGPKDDRARGLSWRIPP